MSTDHETVVNEMNTSSTVLRKEYDELKSAMEKLKKENSKGKSELKIIKEENAKLNTVIGNIQCDKDKVEAESKAKEKLEKIKSNTKLFNDIIEQKLASGELKDIDMSKYKDSKMEECDGGYGNEDLHTLGKNKNLGGRRTNPQEGPEVNKFPKVHTCPQCDYISQNEMNFNEHVTKAHSGQPTCPFCFVAFKDYTSVRKHCEGNHKELRNDVQRSRNIPGGWKKPCRFFNNGEGQCTPRSGSCNYDHTVIPDNEREICFHKEKCSYKPYCIFFHPEGQGRVDFMFQKRGSSKICRFEESGIRCPRSVCSFFHPSSHPSMRNSGGFQWDQERQPPPMKEQETESIKILPKRVPVIVKRAAKESLQDLNQSLKKMNLNKTQ